MSGKLYEIVTETYCYATDVDIYLNLNTSIEALEGIGDAILNVIDRIIETMRIHMQRFRVRSMEISHTLKNKINLVQAYLDGRKDTVWSDDARNVYNPDDLSKQFDNIEEYRNNFVSRYFNFVTKNMDNFKVLFEDENDRDIDKIIGEMNTIHNVRLEPAKQLRNFKKPVRKIADKEIPHSSIRTILSNAKNLLQKCIDNANKVNALLDATGNFRSRIQQTYDKRLEKEDYQYIKDIITCNNYIITAYLRIVGGQYECCEDLIKTALIRAKYM